MSFFLLGKNKSSFEALSDLEVKHFQGVMPSYRYAPDDTLQGTTVPVIVQLKGRHDTVLQRAKRHDRYKLTNSMCYSVHQEITKDRDQTKFLRTCDRNSKLQPFSYGL